MSLIQAEPFLLEELIGSKLATRVLRVLCRHLSRSITTAALALELRASRASVSGVMQDLVGRDLVRVSNGQLFQANPEHGLIRRVWDLLMWERRLNLQPAFKNIVEAYFDDVQSQVEVFVVFGSVARGIATESSDIDLCIVGNPRPYSEYDFLPSLIEIHRCSHGDLQRAGNLVILDALLHGIVFKGGDTIFGLLKELTSFPKSHLVHRLVTARRFLDKASNLSGDARKYYESLADTAVEEVASVLYRGTTLSKRELEPGRRHDVGELEEALAWEGDQILLNKTFSAPNDRLGCGVR